ncbi:hypothetical protein MMPV_002147 [Pyropia vietnamensis]
MGWHRRLLAVTVTATVVAAVALGGGLLATAVDAAPSGGAIVPVRRMAMATVSGRGREAGQGLVGNRALRRLHSMSRQKSIWPATRLLSLAGPTPTLALVSAIRGALGRGGAPTTAPAAGDFAASRRRLAGGTDQGPVPVFESVDHWVPHHLEAVVDGWRTLPSSTCIARWKGGFIAALFVEGVIGGVAPQALQLLSPAVRSRSLHIANAFSGGILFSTGMIHILPEAVAHIAGEGHGSDGHDDHEEEGHDEDEHDDHDHDDEEHGEGEHEDSHGFPTGYALAVAGFYFIFFLEHLVLGKYTHSHGINGTTMTKGQSSPSGGHSGANGVAMTHEGDALGVKASDADYTAVVEDGDEPAQADAAVGGALQRGVSNVSTPSVPSAATDASDACISAMKEAENARFFSPNFWRAFLTAASVAIHTVFESMSLGLASSWTVLFNTFLAIAIHKWATAASLGVKFEKERLRWLQSLVLVVAWAAVTPAAAGIGAAITRGVSDEVTGVLLALSVGTFLYIGVFEVNAEEFIEHTRDRWAKAAATILGAGVIMAITAIVSQTGIH